MSILNKLTEEMMPALQGLVPSTVATCASDGIPNVSYVSQVFYVDDSHVAISNQFFNKTTSNISENPQMTMLIASPNPWRVWRIMAVYKESQTEGDTFDDMEMQLEAIASMTNMGDVFKLQAADVYEIKSIEELPHL